jgi:hypothetical protein
VNGQLNRNILDRSAVPLALVPTFFPDMLEIGPLTLNSIMEPSSIDLLLRFPKPTSLL